MAKYLILTPLRREGKRLAAGGLISLTLDQAQPLLILGAISPDPAAEQAEAAAKAQAEAEAAAKAQAEADSAAQAQAEAAAKAQAEAEAEATAKAKAEADAQAESKASKPKGERLL